MNKEMVDQYTVYKTIVGSQAYGTSTPTSDLDVRGVAALGDPSYYMGFLNRFEQYEDKVNDIIIYDIRKAFKLFADCNPNMIDLLFVEDKFQQYVDPIWETVLDNRDKFLSTKAKYTYTGYAFAQLKRIKNARNWLLNPPKKKPEREDFGLQPQRKLSVSDQGAFSWLFANLLNDTLDYLNFSDETKEELSKANLIGPIQAKGVPDEAHDVVQKSIGSSDQWMDQMKKEQAYTNAKRQFDSYINWKSSRNKKRAELEEKYGYDCKNAMHLVRLLKMGKEILSTGKVHVYRPDRDELLAIRNGAWSYERVEEFADKMNNEIVEIAKKSSLPNKPNRVYLDELCCSVVQKVLSRST